MNKHYQPYKQKKNLTIHMDHVSYVLVLSHVNQDRQFYREFQHIQLYLLYRQLSVHEAIIQCEHVVILKSLQKRI